MFRKRRQQGTPGKEKRKKTKPPQPYAVGYSVEREFTRKQMTREEAAKRIIEFFITKTVPQTTIGNEVQKINFEDIQKLINGAIEELYKSLDPQKPIVFIISTHGSIPKRQTGILNTLKDIKNSVFEKILSQKQPTYQVSYIKAYKDGVNQLLSSNEVSRFQRYLGEVFNNGSLHPPNKYDNTSGDEKSTNPSFIETIAKDLKSLQFDPDSKFNTSKEYKEYWDSIRAGLLMEAARSGHLDEYEWARCIMAIGRPFDLSSTPRDRWEFFQHNYKSGGGVPKKVEKNLIHGKATNTESKGTDWSIRVIDKDGEAIAIPYIFSPYSHYMDIGSYDGEKVRILPIESLPLFGSQIIETRKREYDADPDAIAPNTTMIVVDFSCGTYREYPERPPGVFAATAARASPFDPTTPSSPNGCVGCAIAGGGTKSKKKKSYKSKRFKNNKKRSNKKINRRKYTRKK